MAASDAVRKTAFKAKSLGVKPTAYLGQGRLHAVESLP